MEQITEKKKTNVKRKGNRRMESLMVSSFPMFVHFNINGEQRKYRTMSFSNVLNI